MTPEVFERLLSEWLDEPGRAALREQVESAARGDARLAALRDEWLRLHGAVRAVADIEPRVDWARVARAYSAAVGDDPTDASLEQALAGLRGAPHVDWATYRARLISRLHSARGRVIRLAWVGSAAAALSAAALWAFIVLGPQAAPPPRERGVALVRVAHAGAGPRAAPHALIEVVVERDPVQPEPPVAAVGRDRIFMIDPPARAESPADAAALGVY